MTAGKLDRRVQFQRSVLVDDGFAMVETWADHGSPQWAKKTDISDVERWRASEVSASISTRFVLRHSAFTRDITPKDRLSCESFVYDISGIKEVLGRHRFLEITASALVDL